MGDTDAEGLRLHIVDLCKVVSWDNLYSSTLQNLHGQLTILAIMFWNKCPGEVLISYSVDGWNDIMDDPLMKIVGLAPTPLR